MEFGFVVQPVTYTSHTITINVL